MRIYLAARYSRREELCGYRARLRQAGYKVDAVWLDGKHDREDESAQQDYAREDCRDVRLCDLLIAFTELPKQHCTRGGRHVELGMALGLGKRVWIVGPRENVFCHLPAIKQFNLFDDAFALLTSYPDLGVQRKAVPS